MAKIENNSIVFSKEEEDYAWNNSVGLIDIKDNSKKMCYICRFEMEYKNKHSKTNKDSGWIVDFINIKKIKKSIDGNNLIAVHYNCFTNVQRVKSNMTREIEKIKSYLWKSSGNE